MTVVIRLPKLACLVGLILTATPALRAQTPAQKGRIAEIKFSGSHRYPAEAIAAAIGLHVGDIAGREELQAAADHLAQLGPFTQVNFHFSSRGEALAVEFQVEDAPAVLVSFDNFPWFTDAELTAALKQAVTFFDGTAPEQGAVLDAMAETLVKQLATREVRATVERTLLAQPSGDGMMQQFRVVGPALKIEAVQFGDALAVESRRVQERLSDLVGKPYSRFAVEMFANEQVRPVYLETGHLRMLFGAPMARFTGPPDRRLAETVLVILPIEPGPIYRWGGTEWSGQGVFGPAALNEFVDMKPGEAANGVKIAGAFLRVQEEYGRRGYLDMRLDAQPRFDDAAQRVTYHVTITEGSSYRMGELVLTGLSLAAEGKVREALRLARGEIFDRIFFNQLLTKLEKPSPDIFGDMPVHYEQMGHWLRTNPETRVVDVLLDFK